MTKETNLLTKISEKSGYAADLANSILNGDGQEQDPDSLFRTLMMDEHWSLVEAMGAYQQAVDFMQG